MENSTPEMKTALLSLLAALLMLNRSQAILGETESQIEARYGKATEVLESSIHTVSRKEYQNNGLCIIVSYIDGKSVYERYSDLAIGTLNPTQLAALLDLNALGGKWVKLKSDAESSNEVWKSENGNVTAFNGNFGLIVIFTKEYNDLLKGLDIRNKEADPVKGS
jgi:hypothetical protein